MISARNAAMVVLPSSSLMVALISQMQRTKRRHGPAATMEACANDAARSPSEAPRYRRSSANPIPATHVTPVAKRTSGHQPGRRLHMLPVDRCIGIIDDMEIIIALHALLHDAAQPLAPIMIAQELGNGGRGLLGRGHIGEKAACAQRRVLIAPAEQ